MPRMLEIIDDSFACGENRPTPAEIVIISRQITAGDGGGAIGYDRRNDWSASAVLTQRQVRSQRRRATWHAWYQSWYRSCICLIVSELLCKPHHAHIARLKLVYASKHLCIYCAIAPIDLQLVTSFGQDVLDRLALYDLFDTGQHARATH
jgi:hypothetical protein